jgi:hypothetical protein
MTRGLDFLKVDIDVIAIVIRMRGAFAPAGAPAGAPAEDAGDAPGLT